MVWWERAGVVTCPGLAISSTAVFWVSAGIPRYEVKY